MQTEPNAFIHTKIWKSYKTPINQKNKTFRKSLMQNVSTNEGKNH